MSFVKYIFRAGASDTLSRTERRSVILCNSFSLAFATIPFIFVFAAWIVGGTARFSWPLLIQPLVMLIPIPVNALGFTRLSRILLSWLIPSIVIVYSVYNKQAGIDVDTSSYVGFRITMIASTMVPFLVFNTNQLKWMALALVVPLIVILGFDPIHSFFGVGYTQVGLSDPSYYLNNIRAFIIILMIGSVSLIMKRMVDLGEAENTRLVSELQDTQQKLQKHLTEIVDQNDEINKQNKLIENQNLLLESRYQSILKNQQYLIESKESLAQANEIIAYQKQLLATENKQLELELIKRNKELEKTVQDLIQSNNNLMQYSFMVSHNLRGPVASILGLLNIVPKEKLDPELRVIYDRALQSSLLLDSVISDINTVLDVQKNIRHVRQKVDWDKLISRNLQFFHQEIESLGILIHKDFQRAPFTISIRPILESIVYNLISNAIKFRSPLRPLVIRFETRLENQSVLLKVTDNGLGINLKTQRENIFKIYKRLHNHVEGKGLGLYMVKVQTELLNGLIDVESEVDQFTSFTIHLPIDTTSEQILFDEEYGKIIYNAFSNSTEIHFKRNFTSKEFREIYEAGLDYFKRFNVSTALADISTSDAPTAEDQQWLVTQIIPEAALSGLRKVALVTRPMIANAAMEVYLREVDQVVKSLGIEQQYFENHQEARQWLLS